MARSTTRTRRGKSNTVRLDMRGVESRKTPDEGEYLVKVSEVTQEKGDKADYFAWQFEIVDGDFGGSTLYNNTSLSDKALWNLKSLLEALGVEIPDEAFDLDLDEMKDLELMVSVEHETFEGKKRAKIVDFWPVEDKPKERSRRSSRDDKGDTRTSSRRSSGKNDKEPARGKSKEPDPVTQDELNDMSQDELEDVIKDFELDVDLTKFKTLGKMRAAVIDAAEEAKVLG